MFLSGFFDAFDRAANSQRTKASLRADNEENTQFLIFTS